MRQVSVGLKVEPYDTARLHKDGRSVDVLLSVSRIYDAYGVIVGASKISHDISARKDAERLQSVLVGELNHRVKNLLAIVLAIARQTLGHGQIDAADECSHVWRICGGPGPRLDRLGSTNWDRVSRETGRSMGGSGRPAGDPTDPKRFWFPADREPDGRRAQWHGQNHL